MYSDVNRAPNYRSADGLFGIDTISKGGGGINLIPGMGGMNPTGVDPNAPTGISLGGGLLDNLTSGGRGITPMPTPSPVGDIGGPVADTNIGLVPGTTIPSSFPANIAGTVGGAGESGISGLNLGQLLGFNPNDPNMISQLDNMFGKGVGAALAQFLGGGAGYNPQIATALINQMAPQEERTRNQILESFGASGGRYSSPAAIGLADYESSYSLGQQGILANLASQATDRYSNLFSGLIDTAYLTQANKLSPWNIVSGIIGLLGNTGLKLPIPGIPGMPGSTGPPGPQGPQGKPGPTGPTQTTPQTDPTGKAAHDITPITGVFYDPDTGLMTFPPGVEIPGIQGGPYGTGIQVNPPGGVQTIPSDIGPWQIPESGDIFGSGSTGYDVQEPIGSLVDNSGFIDWFGSDSGGDFGFDSYDWGS